MTTITIFSPRTALRKSLTYLGVALTAGALYSGYYFGNKAIHESLRRKQMASEKAAINALVQSGKYDDAIKRCDADMEKKIFDRLLSEDMKRMIYQNSNAHLTEFLRNKLKIEDYAGALEKLNELKGKPLVDDRTITALTDSVNSLHPTNFVVRADSSTNLEERVVLYKKAEQGLTSLKLPTQEVRNKGTKTGIEYVLQGDSNPMADQTLDRFNQLVGYVGSQGGFKVNVDKELVDKLFDKVKNNVGLYRSSTAKISEVIAGLKRISPALGVSQEDPRILGIASSFVDYKIENAKKVKPQEFGALGLSILEEAIFFNEKYKVGKEKDIAGLCVETLPHLKENIVVREKIARFVYKNIEWLPENKRSEVKSMLLDMYLSGTNVPTNKVQSMIPTRIPEMDAGVNAENDNTQNTKKLRLQVEKYFDTDGNKILEGGEKDEFIRTFGTRTPSLNKLQIFIDDRKNGSPP